MKNKVLKKRIVQEIFYWSLFLAGTGYFFSFRFASWTVLLFLIISWYVRDVNWIKNPDNKFLFVPVLFLIVMALSLFHKDAFPDGWNVVQRFISFAALPLAFAWSRKKIDVYRTRFEKHFVIATSIFYLIAIIVAIYRQVMFTWKKNGPFNWYFFYRYDFLEVFHQHPTYTSMFALMALSFLLFRKQLFRPGIKYFLLTVLLIGFIFTGSRMGYLLLFILFTLYVFFRLKKFHQRILGIFIIIIAMLGIYQIPIVKERVYYTLGIQYDYKYNHKEFVAKGNPEKQGRITSWIDTWELIKKKPLFGWGPGNDDKKLLEYYKQKNHLFLYSKKFNVHNSYLQYTLAGGILLLLTYLFILGSVLYYSIKKRDIPGLIFFLILFFFSITETFYRVQGIIFIAFFYAYFLSHYRSLQSH